MSLTFRLTHTVFDGTKANFISNLFMQPTQGLFDGRSYFVYFNEEGDFSHICFNEVTSRVITLLKTFTGLIHTSFCLFNIIGLAMKTISYHAEPNEAYFFAEGAVNGHHKWPMINMAAMRTLPPKIEPTAKELKAIQSLKLTDLLTIWDAASSSHAQAKKIHQDLKGWLSHIVPKPEKYNYISQKVAPLASAKLTRTLLLIIHQLQTLSHLTSDQKERFILRIYDKAFFTSEELHTRLVPPNAPLARRVTCSPTWIEVAEQVYKELKGAGAVQDRLLHYLQQIKEDIIYETSEDIQRRYPTYNIEWHGLNIGRTLIGREIALDRSNLQFDSTFHFNLFEGLAFKYPALFLFYRHCSPQGLKDRLIKKIALDHQGIHTNGLDQDLMLFLKPDAQKHALACKINPEDADFDLARYVMETYFEQDSTTNKYQVNDLGAQALLNRIGIPV